MSHDERRAADATRSAAVSTDDKGEERKSALDLSIPQLLAGALAAASAAVAASWLGVAGTVLGAVVASVVVSVSSALYTHSLEKSHQVIKETLPVLPVPRVVRIGGATEAAQAADDAAGAGPGARAAETAELAPAPSPTKTRVAAPVSSGRIRWGAVAVTSLIILVAGFGMLTVFETVIGKTAASITGSNDGKGTTVGRLVDPRGDSEKDVKKEPAENPPADDEDPTAPATEGDPSEEEPTTEPATSEAPTEAPTTEAPTTEPEVTEDPEPVSSVPPTTLSTQGSAEPSD